ncbi:MAG TPA: uracil-DNA glycosylase [Chromatiales bacterium]|jgi:uracil-DNA glycosylase family 4|nr:uracil-DNA glycosylase [Chromatiaceae bacterium]HIB83951.1 uracil-DNA glycosylase [Chromatiaceae bacterium]HIN81646.1 uracil-DNA glycosylase [Chromatiales bacterium]HIO14600.1 uracil-DNA glycosylase [Chromatiales bacterium]HIO54704.1 uracil-DNA glycosylase [Chromatiales bacterium]
MTPTSPSFDPDCTRCPRLASFLADTAIKYPDYHCRPVAPFGDAEARLLIVGLAPGLHGANATGRPFTGDFAGILLYQTLHRFGYATQPDATALDDGLELHGCRITNAVKCLPPANKPIGDEVSTCNQYLQVELNQIKPGGIILVLGGLAHNATLKSLGIKQKTFRFGHNQLHALDDGRYLLDSYHCSRYNTQTRRLTEAMFHDVFDTVASVLETG